MNIQLISLCISAILIVVFSVYKSGIDNLLHIIVNMCYILSIIILIIGIVYSIYVLSYFIKNGFNARKPSRSIYFKYALNFVIIIGFYLLMSFIKDIV